MSRLTLVVPDWRPERIDPEGGDGLKVCFFCEEETSLPAEVNVSLRRENFFRVETIYACQDCCAYLLLGLLAIDEMMEENLPVS